MKGGKKKSGGGGSSSGEAAQLPLPPRTADGDGNEMANMPRNGDEEAGMIVGAEDHAEQQNRLEEVDGEGEDGGEEGEEEVEEGDEDYDQFSHRQVQDGKAEAGRPKLAEGFYEIEAVRKKRVRKGEVQYLIKWRDWPETANTWEPLENLQSCSDVIDAFEESLQSGNHRSWRRRKRKSGGPHLQPKKKQQLSPAAATYNVPAVKVTIIDESLPSATVTDSNPANERENNGGDVNNVDTLKQADENWATIVSPQIDERKEQNDLDLKLSELKGTMHANEGNGDKFATHIQEVGASVGNGPANGLSKADGEEPAQAGRCSGAKRRKSGFVKRFKQDSATCVSNDAQNVTARTTDGPCGRVGGQGIQNSNSMGNDLGLKNKFDNSINMSTITKIIKPISYSASVSNNVQDVLVTFMAIRSDGKEVMVDNKFLKANNPLLVNGSLFLFFPHQILL
ncbi:hypothetical protein F0562_014581 [Nyssa sinensis]|uniref:Chromo domain-containing protein n=1 Tax=Nyssa sinensis TaxID=561372 RepID=A0A5J4ZNU6_9ASTE|nr:hypothetical protein F0562_014581 [Nyssa sinensis]